MTKDAAMNHLGVPTRANVDPGRDRRLERLTAAGWVFGSFASGGVAHRTWLVVGHGDGRIVQGAAGDEPGAWSRAIAAAERLYLRVAPPS